MKKNVKSGSCDTRENETLEDVSEDSSTDGKSSLKSKIFWMVLSLLIAVVSITAVMAQVKDYSFRALVMRLLQANPFWISAAILCMLGFIFFEACAIRCICRAFSHGPTMGDSWVYSAADIYFSAITPSATGGQPACAFLMIRDGIPGTAATVSLLLNLMMYTVSTLVVGMGCFILRPGVFLHFGTMSRFLIVAGYIAQIFLALFFYMLVKNRKLLEKICMAALRLLAKLHLLHNLEERIVKLEAIMDDYRKCAQMVVGRAGLLWRVFGLNFLQRISQIAVTVFVFLGMGFGNASVLDVWAVQSFAVLGSNFVPIPGGMGVMDYLMLDGFGTSMTAQHAIDLEMASRSLSFYCCILLCGITLLVRYYRYRKERTSVC